MRVLYLFLLIAATNQLTAQISFTNQSFLLENPTVKSGAPIAIADMNGDSLDDIVRLDNRRFVKIEYQASTSNTLFTSVDVITLNGSSWGICIADVDGNGYNDIFTGGGYNGLKLLTANADGSSYSLTTYSTPSIFLQAVNFADIDNDGHTDIFACHDDGVSVPFRNDGFGGFTADYTLIDASSTVPSDNSGNYGSVWTDYDNDGDLDLYISKCRLGVSNPMDGRRINLLFQNDGNGNYTDVAEAAGLRPLGQSWAADFADIDNDGDLDCFIINHDIESKLYENLGDGTFQDITPLSGMTDDLTIAGPGIQVIFEDFDNDGFEDLLFTSTGGTHCLFKNNGDQSFTKMSGAFPLGPNQRIHSAAVGDLNNDGFIDVYAGFGNNYNSTSIYSDQLFFNTGNANNFIRVQTKGVASNPNGIGARIEVYGPFGKQIREIRSGESYGINNSLTAHFGLGSATVVDRIVVRWPSGAIDELDNPAINQFYVIEEGQFCEPEVGFTRISDGLGIQFNDESGVDVFSWRWDFGDGDTSIVQNPFHVYDEPGNYLVCVEVEGDCGMGEHCETITVNCNEPISNFSYDIDNFTLTFTDETLNYPSSWLWTFGGGASSTEVNPTHTYDVAGQYLVCLLVTNACGQSELCEVVTIGCPSTTSDFSYEANELVVDFEDASGNAPESWFWDFGDGTNSMAQNPQHTFPGSGTYLVCLTTENTCGSDVSCTQITVSCPGPAVGFSYAINDLDVAFFSTNQNVDDFEWDFGDGEGTSIIANPLYTFPMPGTYEVCLTISDECDSSQLCQMIQVACTAPAAAISFNSNELAVSFSDTSTGFSDSWLWDFGDGASSDEQNPGHTYDAPGTYEVCLTINGVCGSDMECILVTVSCPAPTPLFGYVTDELTVDFVDFSQNNPDLWSWNFGDGQFSNQQSPDHTYNAPGTYQVCLTVSTICGAQQVCQQVTVGCAPPTAGFSASNNGSLIWQFTNNSGADATALSWDFGDGTNSSQVNPQHTYASAGTYTVCLTASSICGATQVCETITVLCAEPDAAFSYSTDELTVSFTDNSSNGTSDWAWDFDDGSTSILQNPMHTFDAPGTYTVCLTSTNDCGDDLQCETVAVSCAAPVATISYQTGPLTASFEASADDPVTTWFWDFGDGNTSNLQNPIHDFAEAGNYEVCVTATSICGSSTECEMVTITCPAPFSAFTFSTDELSVSLINSSGGYITAMSWQFGDGNSSNQESPTHTFAQPGTYEICLTTESICGTSVQCEQVSVSCAAPLAGFNFAINELAVVFENTSGNEVTNWFWEFGDGTSATGSDPVHIYDAPGTYEVCLTVESICGSSQTCSMVMVACAGPVADFSLSANGLDVAFSDNSNNNPTMWFWDFGDGTISTLADPLHSYATPGTYTVCLTVESICGSSETCEDVIVNCAAPDAGFSFSSNQLAYSFTDNSNNDPTSWLWTFGDGNTSTSQNPTHSYTLPGAYTVCLLAESICGTDQHCMNLIVTCSAPQADFDFQANELEVSFSDISMNNPGSWLWTFGDGDSSTEQMPAHEYENPGSYLVCLQVTSVCGSTQRCELITVSCSPAEAAFEYGTDELLVEFMDLTSPSAEQYLWTFGDGNTSTAQNPAHEYDVPGTYEVCLQIVELCGTTTYCETIEVSCAPPQAAFNVAINDGTISISGQAGQDDWTWLWDFGDGYSSSLPNPTHTYEGSGEFEICLTLSSICGSTTACQTVNIVIDDIDEPNAKQPKLKLFPNPASTEIFLEVDASTQPSIRFRLLDNTGRELRNMTYEAIDYQNAIRWRVADLPEGVYWVEMLSRNGGRVLEAFVKAK